MSTSLPRRWPLHPPPAPGEALSSWLRRVAEVYHLSVEELLAHNLGPASFDLAGRDIGDLDLNPPEAVLVALHERTGVPLGQLHQMTIVGWVPWLLDSLTPLEPDDGTAGGPSTSMFTTYVQQHSVLLVPGEAIARQGKVPGWRPWLPAAPAPRVPMRRACPGCREAPGFDRGLTLMSQLPLMISCPEHGCRLEAIFGPVGVFVLWQEDDVQPTQADAHVVAMDRRTQEGLDTGRVTLPGRRVHVGVWFRLLRTLLDEVSTPTSQVGTRSRAAIRHVWQTAGHPPRAGQNAWRPYEDLDWRRQQAMLEGAAAALHLVETGAVSAQGALAPLLRPQPQRPVPDGRQSLHGRSRSKPKPPPRQGWQGDHWRLAMEELRAAVAVARTDPQAARQLWSTFAAFSRTAATANRLREALIDTGVPEESLPSRQEIDLLVLQRDFVISVVRA